MASEGGRRATGSQKPSNCSQGGLTPLPFLDGSSSGPTVRLRGLSSEHAVGCDCTSTQHGISLVLRCISAGKQGPGRLSVDLRLSLFKIHCIAISRGPAKSLGLPGSGADAHTTHSSSSGPDLRSWQRMDPIVVIPLQPGECRARPGSVHGCVSKTCCRSRDVCRVTDGFTGSPRPDFLSRPWCAPPEKGESTHGLNSCQ